MQIITHENIAGNTFFKTLLVGNSGTGKTFCCAKAPRPLILEPAQQAFVSIRAAREDQDNITTIFIDSMHTLRNVIYSLQKAEKMEIDGEPALKVTLQENPKITQGKPKVFGEFVFQTLVLDDFEEIQTMYRKEIQEGKPFMDLKKWGLLSDKCEDLIKAFKNLHCNFICCVKPKTEQDDESQVHTFALQGSIKNKIGGIFNAIGLMQRTKSKESGEIVYFVNFAHDRFPTRPHPDLDIKEIADPRVWWKKINGGTNK